MGSKLTNHLKRRHKNEDKVALALKSEKHEANRLFGEIKREGIVAYNKKAAKDDDPNYQREKKANKWVKMVMCSLCRGFVSTRWLSIHQKTCNKNNCQKGYGLPLEFLTFSFHVNEDFKMKVLKRLKQDEIGSLVLKDKCILRIGEILFHAVRAKRDKEVAVRRSVMQDMRRLARLYTIFKASDIKVKFKNCHDMFFRANFPALREAIDKCCGVDENMKAGLKQNYLYLLKKSAKILQCLALESEEDQLYKVVEHFIQVLELWEDFLFGDAQYQLNKRKNIKLRKPESQPNENDVKKLRDYVIEILSEPTEQRYVKLRDAACTRLTLLNGRRGGMYPYL